MTARATFIHTVPGLVETFRDLAQDLLPHAEIDDVVMQELLDRTISAGELTTETEQELAAAVLERGRDADAVLVTCSTLGPAVDALADRSGIPVLRVDEAMARRAVSLGQRMGVLATLTTTLEPTVEILERQARLAGQRIEVVTRLCEGAFEAVRRGDGSRHDELVRTGLEELLAAEVEVIVLAQASMARVIADLPAQPQVPVLSSPRLAVEQLAQQLGLSAQP
jgi:Asp/Glu/hydantoin racemase